MLALASVILIFETYMQYPNLHTMSKDPQRPPRYPLPKKNIDSKLDHDSPASCTGLVPHNRHSKSLSESFIDEEKPPWFDDLLSEQDSDSYNGFNLRSSSYSSSFLDLLNELGPSTDRSQLTFPISSALSNSVSQKTWKNSDESHQESESSTNHEFSNETIPTKRLHPGQRRRAWKVQNIAELERTVSILQTFASELAIKVSVMVQQRTTLQMENSKLKQQMIKLQQENLIADGQYQSLRKEAERLKARLHSHSKMSKISTLNGLNSAANLVGSKASWQMLDLWKLDLI